MKLLAPVEQREPQVQADLAVAKARDTLVATRAKLVNHVRGMVKSFGERLPMSSAASFTRQRRSLLPAQLKPALEPIYQALERIDEQIKLQDKMIERVASPRPVGGAPGKMRAKDPPLAQNGPWDREWGNRPSPTPAQASTAASSVWRS